MLLRLIRFLATVLAASVLAVPAWAGEISTANARHVKTVVQGQLSAFASDDAHKAFSFAAPRIQQMFGTPDKFMAMVRAQYPMVHRAVSASFLKPEADGDAVLQRVQVTDASGSSWLATYLMHRQKDKSWRIGGCVVVPAQQRLTT